MPPNTKAFRWLRIKSRVKGFLRVCINIILDWFFKNTLYLDIILNEVGSTDRSVLKGALEVFGKNAAVVIANPNGFYCDKCSFINTSQYFVRLLYLLIA
jgi:filamentous hemagglutinin family protein